MSPPAENARCPAPVMTMQPDVGVGAHPDDGVVQLGAELPVHRVELLGPVHGDDRDAFRLLDEHVVRHVFLPRVASE